LCTNEKTIKNQNIMTQEAISPKKIMIDYGVLLGIISLLLGVLLYVTNNHVTPHWSFALFGFSLFIIVIVLGLKKFKNSTGGFMSLGEALKIGLGIALISAIIGLVWQLVMTNILDPEYAAKTLEVQREQMIESQPEITEEQLDATMEMIAGFSNPILSAAIQLLAGIFFGFIISLIAGVIMKKENPYANVEQ
jgi:hypothetical protein